MSSKEFVKIAVGLREHPKVLQAGDEAGWLFVCAIMWSKEHDTDGFIPEYAVARLTGLKRAHVALDKCVKAGLLETVEGGWRIHDYLDHQESAERRRAAGRKAAAVRWGSDPDANRNATASDSDANRIQIASTNRNTEEEKEKEKTAHSPPGGKVVTFHRKPVPPARLELAERILADFNEQAGTGYGAYTGEGKPSEDLKRILGALAAADPPLEFDEARRVIRSRLARPFWDGKPHTGVVFGPNVLATNRENATAAGPRNGRSELDALAANAARARAQAEANT